ncbi:Putative protein [Zobellia galactanivorans]|uniref:Uncharacterized protein n=1 Tax=Zobellia galactanivorans (strain DSM 12802 / CCUG 47099 / CIP 106680 / NCIMB 13871 / Dsij) TaxID=63186 RepID=G0L5M0_ZOBGA|nr:Putative protein [Zobellia galactanivorans]
MGKVDFKIFPLKKGAAVAAPFRLPPNRFRLHFGFYSIFFFIIAIDPIILLYA